MKHLLFFFLTITTAAGAQESSCIKCHISGDRVTDTTIAAAFLSGDIHQQNGVGCEKCHGGDPTKGFAEDDPDLAMNPAKGFKPAPGKPAIPAFCARCHSDIEYMKMYDPKLATDQLALYKTSIHGKRLNEDKDTKVAVCSDCHNAHGVLPPQDPRSTVYYQNIPSTCANCHSDSAYMVGYTFQGQPLPTNQYVLYSRSVHGVLVLQKGDQSAPACNGCHGNHGATLPTLTSVAAACGECHASNRDFFDKSPHAEALQEMGFPDCQNCHGNHLIHAVSDSLIGTTDGALCIQCHDEGSPGYEVAAVMKAAVDSLKAAIASADSVMSLAERKGVEGGQARFDLGPANDDLTKVRPVIHTVDTIQVREITDDGIKIAGRVHEMAEASLGDLLHRQIGLWVALALVLFVAVGLWFKIKQVDRETDFTKRG
jgi:predicted CXXCH cytochrome family protein